MHRAYYPARSSLSMPFDSRTVVHMCAYVTSTGSASALFLRCFLQSLSSHSTNARSIQGRSGLAVLLLADAVLRGQLDPTAGAPRLGVALALLWAAAPAAAPAGTCGGLRCSILDGSSYRPFCSLGMIGALFCALIRGKR